MEQVVYGAPRADRRCMALFVKARTISKKASNYNDDLFLSTTTEWNKRLCMNKGYVDSRWKPTLIKLSRLKADTVSWMGDYLFETYMVGQYCSAVT